MENERRTPDEYRREVAIAPSTTAISWLFALLKAAQHSYILRRWPNLSNMPPLTSSSTCLPNPSGVLIVR